MERRTRRQAIALSINLACVLGVLWPLVGWGERLTPRWFGLPPGLVWIAGCLLLGWLALLWLFLGREEQDR